MQQMQVDQGLMGMFALPERSSQQEGATTFGSPQDVVMADSPTKDSAPAQTSQQAQDVDKRSFSERYSSLRGERASREVPKDKVR